MLNLQNIAFGQRHRNFDYEDFKLVCKIQRLARKHHRQCENDANGEGFVNGKFYRCDGSTEGAYVSEDVTIFYSEIERIEKKIIKLIAEIDIHPVIKCYRVEFQGDPRGATVKLYYEDDYIEL